MPLNAPGLSTLMKSKLEAVLGVSDPVELEKLTLAIAEAVVEHIQTNAVVTVTGVEGGMGTAPGVVG